MLIFFNQNVIRLIDVQNNLFNSVKTAKSISCTGDLIIINNPLWCLLIIISFRNNGKFILFLPLSPNMELNKSKTFTWPDLIASGLITASCKIFKFSSRTADLGFVNQASIGLGRLWNRQTWFQSSQRGFPSINIIYVISSTHSRLSAVVWRTVN